MFIRVGEIDMKKRSKAKKRNKSVKAHRAKTSQSATIKAVAPSVQTDNTVTEGGDKASVGETVIEDKDSSLTQVEKSDAVDEQKKRAFLDSENFVSLEQAKEYWLLGEWEKLVAFDLEFLQNHPDREEFALLVGSACLQLGDLGKGKEYIKLALEWGCSQHDIGKVLVAGIHNTLGGIKNLTSNNDVFSIANKCLAAEDIYNEIDKYLLSSLLDDAYKLKFCIALSDRFFSKKNNLMAQHFLTTAESFLTKEIDKELLVKQWLLLGRSNEAFDILVKGDLKVKKFTKNEREKLLSVYNRVRKKEIDKGEHGHHLLLEYLEGSLSKYKKMISDRVPTLIEVGTTRENIPGQGSTRKIAEFCKRNKMQFITVDMDSHNTDMAYNLFIEMEMPFKAINSKGENYLSAYAGYMDFVFLDAYDFDHGNHSELRQSRYEKFLGNRIDEKKCHQMHLECAESIAVKLQPHGVVSIDDTWLVDGKWCAKGTLAVPYLLENGFEVIVAKNRSVLMRRIQN